MFNQTKKSKSYYLLDILSVFVFIVTMSFPFRFFANIFPIINFDIWSVLYNFICIVLLLIKIVWLDKSNLKSVGLVFNNLHKQVLMGFIIAICQFFTY